MSLTDLRVRAVRARLAEAALPPLPPPILGAIVLRLDQRRTAARVAFSLVQHGGCVLADEVGSGKTFVALAVAREWHRTLVVVPASLRRTWHEALERTQMQAVIVSHESLSRGRMPKMRPDGIIVDESHHFRTTATRRYAALTTLSRRARLVLLSATPLQNRTRDLSAQVALFLGASALRMPEQQLIRYVVRSGEDNALALPRVAPPEWIRLEADDGELLEQILSLPPPPRALDAGDGGVLRMIGLVRAWASSRAAFASMLRRRWRTVAALEQSLAEGRLPTRHELRAWSDVGGDVQLGFPGLLVTTSVSAAQADALRDSLERERSALARISEVMGSTSDPDPARHAALREIRGARDSAAVIAFSELAHTARSYFLGMRSDAGVALLTSGEARIASGRIARQAVLDAFAPVAQRAASPRARERVGLLIATDLLSEGLNLQDASTVVHLDLPWNPARLTQRVGRVRRPGGSDMVYSFLLAPPAGARLLLDVEQRLRRKLGAFERFIGRPVPVIPLSESAVTDSYSDSVRCDHAESHGVAFARLAGWMRPSLRNTRRILIGACRATSAGWIAALDDGRVVASVARKPPDTAGEVVRAVELASGVGRAVTREESVEALAAVTCWLLDQRIDADAGLATTVSAVAARCQRRIASIIARAARHRRDPIVRMASSLRMRLSTRLSLGIERQLAALLVSETRGTEDDERWLRDVAAVLPGPGCDGPRRTDVIAIVVFGPR